MSTLKKAGGRPRHIGPIACRSCDLNEVCRLTGLIAFDAGRSWRSSGALRSLETGAPLFRAGSAANAIYAVRQGMLKTTRVSAEGDERIVGFHTPGEVLGLEAFGMGSFACDAIALEPSVCCELTLPLPGDGRVHELSTAMIRLLSKAAEPRLDLARGSARERVTNFLLDLARRLGSRGFDANQLILSMSRQEIADFLDTRIETVSRVLQQLNREKAIHVRGSRVNLLRLSA